MLAPPLTGKSSRIIHGAGPAASSPRRAGGGAGARSSAVRGNWFELARDPAYGVTEPAVAFVSGGYPARPGGRPMPAPQAPNGSPPGAGDAPALEFARLQALRRERGGPAPAGRRRRLPAQPRPC